MFEPVKSNTGNWVIDTAGDIIDKMLGLAGSALDGATAGIKSLGTSNIAGALGGSLPSFSSDRTGPSSEGMSVTERKALAMSQEKSPSLEMPAPAKEAVQGLMSYKEGQGLVGLKNLAQPAMEAEMHELSAPTQGMNRALQQARGLAMAA